MYYVYIYKTPINSTVSHTTILANQPFYIGKGKDRRFKDHLSESSKKTSNHLKIAVITRIRDQGIEPIIEIYKKELTDEQAKLLEIELIHNFGRIIDHNGPLTNKTLGGDGCTGFTHSEETKKNFSKIRKGKSPYNKGLCRPGIGGRKLGTTWSEAEREKHAVIRSKPGYYDFNKDPERIKKISESKKGKPGPSTGKTWFNNGTKETYSHVCPDGFFQGRLPRLQYNKRGLVWYNNGVVNKQFKEGEQLEGFIRGRIIKK